MDTVKQTDDRFMMRRRSPSRERNYLTALLLTCAVSRELAVAAKAQDPVDD